MRCEYTVTPKDFFEAVKAYRKVSRQALVTYWLCIWIMPFIGIGLALTFLPAFFLHDSDFYTALWAGSLGLGMAFGFPGRYRLGLRRAFNQRNVLAKDRPVYCEFDDKIIRFVVPGGTEISYPWESFTDYFENERVAVLFVKDAAFHTIPKRALDEEGWATFRSTMRSHNEVREC